MMKCLVAILAGVLLAACGGNGRTSEFARYDFGDLPGKGSGSRVPIATVEVQAASWMEGPAMYFRLGYADSLRRQSYADSRWAAPPAELLEAFLMRRMVFGQADLSGAGCRLQLVLDEMEQRFDDPQRSQVVLQVRALLASSQGAEILSRRVLMVRQAAPTPSAAGAVAATRDAVQALAGELAAWLDEIGRDRPAIVERCRA